MDPIDRHQRQLQRQQRRQHRRQQRLAAVDFLSNISLDGTNRQGTSVQENPVDVPPKQDAPPKQDDQSDRCTDDKTSMNVGQRHHPSRSGNKSGSKSSSSKSTIRTSSLLSQEISNSPPVQSIEPPLAEQPPCKTKNGKACPGCSECGRKLAKEKPEPHHHHYALRSSTKRNVYGGSLGNIVMNVGQTQHRQRHHQSGSGNKSGSKCSSSKSTARTSLLSQEISNSPPVQSIEPPLADQQPPCKTKNGKACPGCFKCGRKLAKEKPDVPEILTQDISVISDSSTMGSLNKSAENKEPHRHHHPYALRSSTTRMVYGGSRSRTTMSMGSYRTSGSRRGSNRPPRSLTLATNLSNKRNREHGLIYDSIQLSPITDCESFNLIAKLGLGSTGTPEIWFNKVLGVKKFQPNSQSEAIAYNNSILMKNDRAAGCSTDEPKLDSKLEPKLEPKVDLESSVSPSSIVFDDSDSSDETVGSSLVPVTPDVPTGSGFAKIDDDLVVNWTYFAKATADDVRKLVYHPDLLDDPALVAEKPGEITIVDSIIDQLKPQISDIELNHEFRRRFPHVQLSLSELRSIKADMCKIARSGSFMDFCAIAQAYVLYEKLLLKLVITKQNWKHCAGACLMLSAKMNDVKRKPIKKMIAEIRSKFGLNLRELLNTEYAVLVALEFSLSPPNWQIQPHYIRLICEN